MTTGRLIAVVGASGVGKDSVMAGIAAAMPAIHRVRRSITRPPEPGGEDHDALDPAAFDAAAQAGAFCLRWRAHGLDYGIPASTRTLVDAGAWHMANLSRSVVPDAAAMFPALTVLNITARPETLRARLAARGRETPQDITRRLARKAAPLPAGIDRVDVANDGPLAATVATAVQALLDRAARDRVTTLERAP